MGHLLGVVTTIVPGTRIGPGVKQGTSSMGPVVWPASYCGVYCGVTLRHLVTASVWRRGREATGAELLFLRGCEGEAANMHAGTAAR
jgi:hypothetical protein